MHLRSHCRRMRGAAKDCKVTPPSVPFSILCGTSHSPAVAPQVHSCSAQHIAGGDYGTDEAQKCDCWCHGFGIDSCLGILKQCAGTNARTVTRNDNASPGAVAAEGGR